MKSINKLLISAVSVISLAMPLVCCCTCETQPNHQSKVQNLNHQTQTNHQSKVQGSKPSDTNKPSEQGSGSKPSDTNKPSEQGSRNLNRQR